MKPAQAGDLGLRNGVVVCWSCVWSGIFQRAGKFENARQVRAYNWNTQAHGLDRARGLIRECGLDSSLALEVSVMNRNALLLRSNSLRKTHSPSRTQGATCVPDQGSAADGCRLLFSPVGCSSGPGPPAQVRTLLLKQQALAQGIGSRMHCMLEYSSMPCELV